MTSLSRHYIISGKVQGVWFRDKTKNKAIELGIYGWVKNTDDGHVECIASATAEVLDQFANWLWQGPEMAVVNDVIQTNLNPGHQTDELDQQIFIVIR